MLTSDHVVRRPSRVPPPAVPSGQVVLQPPPELPKPENSNIWLTALPAMSGLGSIVFLFSVGNNPLAYVAGSLFLVSSLALVAGSVVRARSTQKGTAQHNRRDYLRYLDRMRKQVRDTAAAQRQAQQWGAPAPEMLWPVVDSPRLWERRPSDQDFGVIRVGVGPQYVATPLAAGESGPVEDLDPLSALALKRFIATHSVVPDLPVQLSLRRFAAIRISAERTEAQALARSILAQAATFHAPTDLQILLCTPAPDGPAWGWAKWLPHSQHPTEVDHAGPVRMIGRSLVELEDWLGSELTRRPRFNRTTEPDPELPHLLVVLDGGACTGTELMLGPDGLAAVTVVDLDGGASELADRHGLTLVLDEGTLSVRTSGHLDGLGQADLLAGATAAALAQQLAAYRLDVATARAEDLATTDQTLPALLGISDPGSIDLATLWLPRPTRDHLTVPIGMAADGEPLKLDIKESAQDGMGPHGLVVGATGSGKSELLRTLVLAMATTHPPELLNLVLVDFKGGATFAGMSALPHVAAVITNLEHDLSLVDRMQEALAGELNRRQEILRDAGNLVSVRDYERARTRGADLPALPSLFIVVDEFSELLAQKPDFAHLFVQIGRLGRSLGLHLLLASQRLEESKLRGLEAHLSYRIGLRTFSEQESRMAIGAVDAHHLPQAPGHGYLRTDTSTLRRFRAAYVSGPHRTGIEQLAGALSGTIDVRCFTAALQPVPAQLHQRAPQPVIDPDDADDPEQPTVLGVMVGQMIGEGATAHQVWLPPLNRPETLDRLFSLLGPGLLSTDPARGFGAPPDSSPVLQVPVGLVDRPYHQRRDPLLVDAAGSGGHIAVVGGPRSGKSTMIRTVLAALALRHTPEEVQFFALDFGGALIGLADLPHLSGLASRLDSEVVHRIVAEVIGIVEDREARFRQLGVDSMATYRQLRAQGQVPDDRFGDVFLVVDGWGVLRQNYEDLEHELLALIGRSLNYGVHIVISGNRWLELRLGLRDLIGTKIELKLGDALDSEFDRKMQLTVPENRPGRGATRDKLHFLGALPRVDGRRSDADLGAGIADLTRKIRDSWPGEPAPRVRLLPVSYGFEDVPLAAKQDGVVIGIEGHRLEPVTLRAGQDAGAIVIGDTECGKTTFLRAVARQVIERGGPEQAKIILFDFRLTMLREFSGEQVLDYVTTGQQAGDAVAGLMKGFTKRLPGTDVTPDQLRDRSWWEGPDVYVLIDDYDLVATSAGNPLLPLLQLLPQARNIGLHLYVTRQAGGAARASLDQFLGRAREMNLPAVVMSVPKSEGPVFGVRPQQLKPGRGTLLHRRLGTVPVQLVRCDPGSWTNPEADRGPE